MLGDSIERALSSVGITKDRVERFIGQPCGCKERQDKLNQIGNWAARVLKGKVDRAEQYLLSIINEE